MISPLQYLFVDVKCFGHFPALVCKSSDHVDDSG
jgi:hypothetical protein